MGKCDSCGKKGYFLKTRQCFICKDNLCYDCTPKSTLTLIKRSNTKEVTIDLFSCKKNECNYELESCIVGDWKKTIGTNMDDFNQFHNLFDNYFKNFIMRKAQKL